MQTPFAALAALVLCATAAVAAPQITSVLVAGGLVKPIAVTAPVGDPSRVFIVQQNGLIRILENGVVRATPFLDLSGVISTSGNELGLLSMAFHPNYANNGRFFVFYTRFGDAAGVLAEGSVSADPYVAHPSGSTVLVIPPSLTGDHQGGSLQFGVDGKLYVATGDGGYDNPGDPECDAQNGLSWLGKILRLDVDGAAPYSVPADNPFVGNSNFLPEVWAYGLRHPWRFSFDSHNGDLYVGDVGQETREEINYAPGGQSGMNFGWNVMEAESCTGFAACAGAPTCLAPTLTNPVHHYGHNPNRCAVIGGFVYRGCAIPSLSGHYFFADFCSRDIWSFDIVGGQPTQFTNRTTQLAPQGGGTITQITSFGTDGLGEIYICDRTGKVFKIMPVDDCSISTFGASNVNSTGVAATMSWSGSACLCNSNLVLRASGVPAHKTGLFFMSANALSSCVPFGNGLRCVGTPSQRLPVVVSDANGHAARAFDANLIAQFGITSNDTRHFQYWFRDTAAGGSLTNTSNALSVVFCR